LVSFSWMCVPFGGCRRSYRKFNTGRSPLRVVSPRTPDRRERRPRTGHERADTASHIHKLFERSCELGLWRLTSNKISEIFGQRLHRRLSGKLATVIDQIEHGHHVFRAYFKHAFLKHTRSSPPSCATNCAPTISTTSVSRKAWTISKRSAKSSRPSPATSPPSRRSGSTFTSTFRCCSASPCRSP